MPVILISRERKKKRKKKKKKEKLGPNNLNLIEGLLVPAICYPPLL